MTVRVDDCVRCGRALGGSSSGDEGGGALCARCVVTSSGAHALDVIARYVATPPRRRPPAVAELASPDPMPAVLSMLLVAVVLFYLIIAGALDRYPASPLLAIQQQVATEEEQQYQAATRAGDAGAICEQAGRAAEAHLQARDDAEYRRWKAREARACAATGVAR